MIKDDLYIILRWFSGHGLYGLPGLPDFPEIARIEPRSGLKMGRQLTGTVKSQFGCYLLKGIVCIYQPFLCFLSAQIFYIFFQCNIFNRQESLADGGVVQLQRPGHLLGQIEIFREHKIAAVDLCCQLFYGQGNGFGCGRKRLHVISFL